MQMLTFFPSSANGLVSQVGKSTSPWVDNIETMTVNNYMMRFTVYRELESDDQGFVRGKLTYICEKCGRDMSSKLMEEHSSWLCKSGLV